MCTQTLIVEREIIQMVNAVEHLSSFAHIQPYAAHSALTYEQMDLPHQSCPQDW